MAIRNVTPEEVGKFYSDGWWDEYPDLYEDLIRKAEDPDYEVKGDTAYINRALLTYEYVKRHVPPGGRVLDMACGIGYISNLFASCGYIVEGFDISEKGIERSKDLARKLGHDPDMFSVADHRYIFDLPDESFDAVIAMGFRFVWACAC